MTVSTAPTLADLRTALRCLCAPVEVERDTDRTAPAFGLLVARHGLTLTFGCRVYRVRYLPLLPMPEQDDPPGIVELLVAHWPVAVDLTSDRR